MTIQPQAIKAATLLDSLPAEAVATATPEYHRENDTRNPSPLPELEKRCVDGERTEHLVTIAGKMIASGLPIDRVIAHATDWNSRNDPPLDVEKLINTCLSVMNTHKRNHPEYVDPEDPLTPVEPMFDIASANIARFLETTPPPRRWLLKDFLPLGIAGLVVGPGGIGKSRFDIQLGFAVATGLTLADNWEVGESGSAVLLMAEDDEDELHRRVADVMRQIDLRNALTLSERLRERLYIKSLVGTKNLLTETGKQNREVTRTPLAERLIKTVEGIKDLKLIVIDPASRFRGGEENSNEDATRFVEAIEYLVKKTGATVLVVHHTHKGAMNADEANQNAARGASALSDGFRWQINLTRLTKKDARALSISEDERWRYVQIDNTKNNYARLQQSTLLKLEDGGHLRVADEKRIVEDRTEEAMIRTLRCLQAFGKPISSRECEERFGGTKRESGVSAAKVRAAIKIAIDKEYLSQNGSRNLLSFTNLGERYLETAPQLPTDIAEASVKAHFSAKTAKKSDT